MLTTTERTIAHCAVHPGVESIATCERCGHYMCEDCQAPWRQCWPCTRREVERNQAGLDKAAGRVVLCLRTFLAVTAAQFVLVGLQAAGVAEPAPPPLSDDKSEMTLGDWLTLPQGLLLLLTPIFFALWMRRTNLASAPLVRHMEFGPNAWGWFFMPFLNLVKPYQAVAELYTVRTNGMAQPTQLKLWWGFWIASNVFTRGADRFPESATLHLVSDAVALCAGYFAIKVVQLVTSARPADAVSN